MDTDRMNREQICRIIIEKIEYIKKAEHTGKEKLKKQKKSEISSRQKKSETTNFLPVRTGI